MGAFVLQGDGLRREHLQVGIRSADITIGENL